MPKPPAHAEGPLNCHVQFKVTKPMEDRLLEIAGGESSKIPVLLRSLIDAEHLRLRGAPANDAPPPASASRRREVPTTGAEADAERLDWDRRGAPRRLTVELGGLEAERLDWLRRRAGVESDTALILRWIEEQTTEAAVGVAWDQGLHARALLLSKLLDRVRAKSDTEKGRRALGRFRWLPGVLVAAAGLSRALREAAKAGGEAQEHGEAAARPRADDLTEERLRAAVYRMSKDQLEAFADVVGDRLAEVRRGAGAEEPAAPEPASTPREAARRSSRAAGQHPASIHENGSGDTARYQVDAAPAPEAVPAEPLSTHAIAALDRIARGPGPRSEFNPGVARLLEGERLAEEVSIPSPFQTRKGNVRGLQISPKGEAARAAHHAPPPKPEKLPHLRFDERLELQALVDSGGAQTAKTEKQRRYWRWMAEDGRIAKRARGALTVCTGAGWMATKYGERVLRAQAGGAG